MKFADYASLLQRGYNFKKSQHNLELPEWADDTFLHRLQEAAIIRLVLSTCTTKLARLKTGLLLQEMTNSMNDKVKKKTKRVINMYVAHDFTIANLLNTLGVYDRRLPPYAACVMLELRVDSRGAHYVSLFYRTLATEPPRLLTIPGCDAACPLDRYLRIVAPVLPADWDEECKETVSVHHNSS